MVLMASLLKNLSDNRKFNRNSFGLLAIISSKPLQIIHHPQKSTNNLNSSQDFRKQVAI